MSTPKIPKELKIDDQDISEELKLIAMTIADLTYDGFNAQKTRAQIESSLDTKEIVTLVSAYCQIGGNINRSIGKVKNKREDIAPLLKKTGTTLPRVGLAFPALVRSIRAAYPNDFGKRIIECKTPADFQDPSCAPYHPDGRDFSDKFGKLIFNPKKVKMGVDYFSIAVAGRDPISESLMRSELSEVVRLIRLKKY